MKIQLNFSKICAGTLLLALAGTAACVQSPNEQITPNSPLQVTIPQNKIAGKILFVNEDQKSAIAQIAPGLGQAAFFTGDRLLARDENLQQTAILRVAIINKNSLGLEVLDGVPAQGNELVIPPRDGAGTPAGTENPSAN